MTHYLHFLTIIPATILRALSYSSFSSGVDAKGRVDLSASTTLRWRALEMFTYLRTIRPIMALPLYWVHMKVRDWVCLVCSTTDTKQNFSVPFFIQIQSHAGEFMTHQNNHKSQKRRAALTARQTEQAVQWCLVSAGCHIFDRGNKQVRQCFGVECHWIISICTDSSR